jgi:hypothetical protein
MFQGIAAGSWLDGDAIQLPAGRGMISETLVKCYKIECQLGQGGMGTFYRAHDTLLDRGIALFEVLDVPSYTQQIRDLRLRL